MSTPTLENVDIFEVIRKISRRNKRAQAVILKIFEEVVPRNSHDFMEIRKQILDELNGFTRATIRDIFGDIEVLIK